MIFRAEQMEADAHELRAEALRLRLDAHDMDRDGAA